MTEEIQKELLNLQETHSIKILYAVESGSRAWGFASTDSDWDVRYIYIHQPDWYLSIDEGKDNQEMILPNDIDLAGWELKKALRLFRKSNPPLLEWLRSPMVYMQQGTLAEKLQQLAGQFFSPRSCLYHYLNMAEGNYRTYLQKEMVRVKKYFYVLRPILACDWISSTQTMAPMEFDELLETQIPEGDVKTAVRHLLERKKSGEELKEEPRIHLLNGFLEERIAVNTSLVKLFGAGEPPATEPLNRLFREMLKEAWKGDW